MFNKGLIYAFLIPLLYALGLRYLFGLDEWANLYAVMSVTFFFCLPLVLGLLTVYFSPEEKARSGTYSFFAPWISLFIFIVVTILMNVEGWACWFMILPVFMLASSLGGLLGRFLKFRNKSRNLYVSVFALLPFLLGPVENQIGSDTVVYQAYNTIDIKTSPDVIWKNITRVNEIDPADDTGWLTRFLGFPRPLYAKLDTLAVGGKRDAVFTKGLVFHETVTDYQHLKNMSFSILAYPHEIPSAAMDEHVVVGGRFFNVLQGTYRLEVLDDKTCRLHLSSSFTLNTTFNFYAGLWARWIMEDIQNNILRVEKARSEQRSIAS